jgi:hypothetical protein
LHGALWGEGAGDLLSWARDARWLVVEVDAVDIVQLDGKVKFPRGEVVHCGTRESATAFVQRPGRVVIGATVAAGYAGTATAGYEGTATAGTRGTATAGNAGTATAGDAGTATAGYEGILVVRYHDGLRYRLAVGYVGENGIEPGVPYVVDAGGNLVAKEGVK